MDDDSDSLSASLKWRISSPAAASINNKYGVFSFNREIWFQRLESDDETPRRLHHRCDDTRVRQCLALSRVSPDLLAISSGPRVHVFDLATRKVIFKSPGIGRSVTAIAWSPHGPQMLAVGFVDGSIAFWGLEHAIGPSFGLAKSGSAVTALAFSNDDQLLLASIHGSTACVWRLADGASKLDWTTHAASGRDNTLTWRPDSGQILITTGSRTVQLYNLSHLAHTPGRSSVTQTTDNDDSDDDIFGKLDGVESHNQLTATLYSTNSIVSLEPVGKDIVLALDNDRRRVYLYRIPKDGNSFENLGSCKLTRTAAAIFLRWHDDMAIVIGVGDFGLESRNLPLTSLGNKEELNSIERSMPAMSSSVTTTKDLRSFEIPIDSKSDDQVRMKPVKITARQDDAPGFAKTSRQLRLRRQSSRKTNSSRSGSVDDKTERISDDPSTPQPQSMVSSLELPKFKKEEDVGSPMPFLSPSIPSRRASPNEIPLLDDIDIVPPALPMTSSDSSPPTTADLTFSAANDSDDSDDETFVEDMQGSSTFLPGGINVPLPKACGALFAQNGQLLTFFPPKSVPAVTQTHASTGDPELIGDGVKPNKVARLFPTFGNLAGDASQHGADTDSDDLWSLDGATEATDFQPNIAFQSPSFASQPSWNYRASPTKPGFEHTQQSTQKIVVNVHDISGVAELLPTQRYLAQRYRFLCADGEPAAQLCESNASVTGRIGLVETSSLWRLLGMLLRDEVPLEVLSSNDDVFAIAWRARSLLRNDSGVDISQPATSAGSYGKLRWADHPFGGAWLVRHVIEWAEQQADMQLLAMMVTVLGEAEQTSSKSSVREPSMLTNLPTYSNDYFTEIDAKSRRQQKSDRAIPVLRTETPVRISSLYESPTKVNRSSNKSSRNPSLPPTPYLDSMSSTSPVSFHNFSQPGSRFSTSGSASPEHHRGSFSAAAKYYAQSFTDKFASYGTSPPAKKLGTSPSTSNELSASLPSGSWSKSVSFASISTTANTNRGSLLSTSYDAKNDDGGYDSDKTVEDLSMPTTPRTPTGAVAVSHKNETMFSDELCGQAKIRLMPEDLMRKSKAWCEYYAEQLRSWDLIMQAAELEKVIGITGPVSVSSSDANSDENLGIRPTSIAGRPSHRICAICYTALRKIEQLCSQCLHTSHLTCMEDFIAAIGDEEFTCPTGCGCHCADLAFEVPQLWQHSPDGKPAFKKKPDMTDPRRWRARIEGESW